MTRQDILDMFDDEQHDKLRDVIDYFEVEFDRIHELLNNVNIHNLSNIEEAKDCACNIKGNLY